jgi:hypothetical protein
VTMKAFESGRHGNIGAFARCVRPGQPLKFIGAWRVFNPSQSASPAVILDRDRQKRNEEHGCSSLTEVADEKELIDPQFSPSRSTRRGNTIRPIAKNFLRLPMSFCRYAGLTCERLSHKEALQQEK